jgi:hypothetical protein
MENKGSAISRGGSSAKSQESRIFVSFKQKHPIFQKDFLKKLDISFEKWYHISIVLPILQERILHHERVYHERQLSSEPHHPARGL